MRKAPASSTGVAWLAVALAAVAGCSPARDEARPSATPRAPAAGPSAAGAPDAQSDPSRPLPSPVPEVVARVDGQPIRLAQLLPVARNELKRIRPGEPDVRKAEALRLALAQYVERELLLQHALARGVTADQRSVDWAYDQARGAHRDEAEWAKFLSGEGLDPQSFKAELRVQQTILALVEQEARARGVSPEEARAALVRERRAKARIELYL